MRIVRQHIHFAAFVVFIVAYTACKDTMVISGKVAVAGHAPFSYLRIVDQAQVEYKLVGPKLDILRKSYQGKGVALEGKVVKKAIGPGFPAEFLVVKIVR